VIEIRTTDLFDSWLDALKDREASAVIAARIIRIRHGLLGDVKPVGDKVSELRIDYGPGYRVYFTKQGKTLIILLCGGDKSSQSRDIKTAQKIVLGL
jgi:putative addiction module killer protein